MNENEGSVPIAASVIDTSGMQGQILMVTADDRVLGGVRTDGSVFVNVGIDELVTVAAVMPTTAEAMITLARMAFKAGQDSAEGVSA